MRDICRICAPYREGSPIDASEAFSRVVAPVLGQLFRPGEVVDATVTEHETVDADQGGAGVEVTLQLEALGTSSHILVWDSRVIWNDDSLVDIRVELAGHVQDFIAESPLGWAQLRTFTRFDFGAPAPAT